MEPSELIVRFDSGATAGDRLDATRRAFLRPNDAYFSQLWAMENTGRSAA